MLNKEFLILVCIFAIVIDVYSKPTLLTSGIRYCYKQECPENTFACERLTHTSEDKKYLVAEIHCLDVKGKLPLKVAQNGKLCGRAKFQEDGHKSLLWFQHDGAASHFALPVRYYLNEIFPNRWTGGPVHWPERSPDLTPLDYYLWGHLKALVYETPVSNQQELLGRVMAASAQVQDIPGIFHRVRQSMKNCAQLCTEQRGGHFEQLL